MRRWKYVWRPERDTNARTQKWCRANQRMPPVWARVASGRLSVGTDQGQQTSEFRSDFARALSDLISGTS